MWFFARLRSRDRQPEPQNTPNVLLSNKQRNTEQHRQLVVDRAEKSRTKEEYDARMAAERMNPKGVAKFFS